jgi:hypothetical protein
MTKLNKRIATKVAELRPEIREKLKNHVSRFVKVTKTGKTGPFRIKDSDANETDTLAKLIYYIIRERPVSYYVDENGDCDLQKVHFKGYANRSYKDLFIICKYSKYTDLTHEQFVGALTFLVAEEKLGTLFCPDIRHQVFYPGGDRYDFDEGNSTVIKALREENKRRKQLEYDRRNNVSR